MKNSLDVQNVVFSYPGNSVSTLCNVSFALEQGGLLCILGPNGTGKSTLLNCVCGLLKPQNGIVIVGEKNIHTMTAKSISQKIGYVRQVQSNGFGYTAFDYVLMGRACMVGLFQKPSCSDRIIAKDAMDLLGVSHLCDAQLSELSGGERQLVSIARVIAQRPEIILLDEPTSFLDYGNQIKILKIIKELNEAGYTIILTTHNPDHCILLQATVGILDKEGTLSIGCYKQMLTEKNLSDLFGTPIKIIFAPPVKRETFVFAGW